MVASPDTGLCGFEWAVETRPKNAQPPRHPPLTRFFAFGAQGDRAHQVIGDHVPQNHRFDFDQTSHVELPQAAVVQRLADGTIGLLVETASGAADRYGEITFYRFNVAELDAKVRNR